MEENVLRGNSAIVKCHIPSFVAEYVTVSSWIISEGDVDELEIKVTEYSNLGTFDYCHIKTLNLLVLTKCFSISMRFINMNLVRYFVAVSQAYTVNLWEENVLRGNAAILKCHIPSFVSEYVTVTSWIIYEGDVEELDIQLASQLNLGIEA